MRTILQTLLLSGIAAACGISTPPRTANFTAITFTFSVAGQIKTTDDGDHTTFDTYDVAIAATADPSPSPSLAPVPVITANNPNGRMAGSPTHFVEFNSLNPGSVYPFTLYRFAPNPGNRSNPTNIAVFAPSTRGQISTFTTPQSGGDRSTLSFTVYSNMLADTDAQARALRTLQVNILTMTRLANQGSGPRVIDALGDSRKVSGLTNFLQIDLLKSGATTNDDGFEPKGDTFGGADPNVDIVKYQITVTK